MDVLSIILSSGYVIDETGFFEIIEILEVQSKIASVHQLEKLTVFFVNAAKFFGFDTTRVTDAVTNNWIKNEMAEPSITIYKANTKNTPNKLN